MKGGARRSVCAVYVRTGDEARQVVEAGCYGGEMAMSGGDMERMR